MKCHVDGELVPEERALSVHDRGFRYGDAAVETVRAHTGRAFRWPNHRQRLLESCALLGIEAPSDLEERVVETLAANGLDSAIVRISVTRGQGGTDDGLTPSDDAEPTVVVTTEPHSSPDGPATLQTVKRRPIPDRAVPAGASTHSRLDRVLARRELAAGADEALVLDEDGAVLGGAASALCLVSEGTLVRPARERTERAFGSLAVELAESESFPVERRRLSPGDVREADEAFLASPHWGLRAVTTVDGLDIDQGPMTALLSRLFAERLATVAEEP